MRRHAVDTVIILCVEVRSKGPPAGATEGTTVENRPLKLMPIEEGYPTLPNRIYSFSILFGASNRLYDEDNVLLL